MGTLFRIRCDQCDTKQNITFDGFAGAAIMHGGVPGDILPQGYLAYVRSEDEIKVLPHPIETLSLEGAGGSWTSATLNGQILSFTNLICTNCGTINTTACVHSGALGCTTGIAAGILMIVANATVVEAPFLLKLALVWLAFFAPMLVCDFYVRRRHSKKAIPYRFSGCTNCGSEAAIPFAKATKVNLPCRKCGQNTATISFAGKS
jgi:hypothetical protein